MGLVRRLDIDKVPVDLAFSIFTSEDIKRLSVARIITGLTFDELGHPISGGPYDNLMGTYGRRMDPCKTCLNIQACPGHMGHIELNTLVFNPFFIKLVQRIISIFCLHCFQIQIKDNEFEIIKMQLRLVDSGYIVEAQELEIFKSEVAGQCTEDETVKLEHGDYVHPQIAYMQQLLTNGKKLSDQNTKTSCQIRSAIVSTTLQRPKNSKCIHCRKSLRNVRFLYNKLVYYMSSSDIKLSVPGSISNTGKNKIMFADECCKLLQQIYQTYSADLELLFPILKASTNLNSGNVNENPVNIFFMNMIPVTPPNTRPTNVFLDQIIEHPQTNVYRNIIQKNTVVGLIMKRMKEQNEQQNGSFQEANQIYEKSMGSTAHEKYYNAWQNLQTSVDMLLDVSLSPRDAASSQGVKQILEKKEGLIRKHMMGKRVNYAARTVITPDPNINVEEIGIPEIFARRLSYPVPVTPWNVAELRKLVKNGPDVYPGANYIQDEKGNTTLIPSDSATKRESMAKLLFNYPEIGIKVVNRHVLNGDPLLLNRQPSLHKPSIMAHRARILTGEKTFRLHYSNCKAYNADFDGDEMNAHYPQCEVARSEAYNLVNVTRNYLVPKDGTPLGGLIQDHVISGVKLSIRGRFFNREDYQQLVFQSLSSIRGNIILLPPTILKPFMLWSGKQVLSTIIINLIPKGLEKINLHSHARIVSKQWNTVQSRIPMSECQLLESQMSESQVIIHKGELLAGVLDKQQYGATTFGLIHCMYELYGGDISTCLLTALTKLFTIFLQREGFTLGVQDILVAKEADSRRQKIIRECREMGNAATAVALNITDVPSLNFLAQKTDEAYIKDPKFRVLLDRKYKSILDGFANNINKACLPNGLITKFPSNNLQLMVLSGAKGSVVNTMQISCLLGQIELEGKRPPLMISGKSLPSFTSFETSPKSGGFIDGRFMTGIQPQDFFFHCMAGREGLIDTAVKTSRSGYLQRCLIKHLEGLTVNYDLTVRDSDNCVIQYLYGEDGLDVLKSKFFNAQFGLNFLGCNPDVILRPNELLEIKDEQALTKIKHHAKKIRLWRKHHKDISEHNVKNLSTAFTQFSAELHNQVEVSNPNNINKKTGRRYLDESILKLWENANEDSKNLYRKKYARRPDPTVSIYKQDLYYGALSEAIEDLIEGYMVLNPKLRSCITDILNMKNMKALAAPGEPVGLLAAQSIGEPSTQMTLNTFHFAGRGEMNVTLGIPRLREILMLASANIKTPSMDIPIKSGQLKTAEKLRIKLNRVTLADIIQFVNIKTKIVMKPDRVYKYEIRFQFLPHEAYKDNFSVRPKQVLKFMTETFFKQLFQVIIKSSRSKTFAVNIDEKNAKLNERNVDGEENYEYFGQQEGATTENNRKKKNSKKNIFIDGMDSDSSDDEFTIEENDTGIKLLHRNQDEEEYDDPEDVDEIKDANEIEDEEGDTLNGTVENGQDDSKDDFTEDLLNNKMVSAYTYDKEHFLWCKLTFNLSTKFKKPGISSIIHDLASKFSVHQVQNIKRAIIYDGDNTQKLLKTDGINIVEMFAHNKLLELNRLYTNDIHAVASTYGIEAAARVIINEVTNVFKVYGITVDRRHLSLISDYMTFDGTFQPLSRKGMEHSSSPLQQISFESCLQFLKTAVGSGRNDILQSPSSRLMVGLPVRNGTGAFEILIKVA